MKKTRSLVLSTAISVSIALLAGCGGADTASTASTVSASAVSSSSSSGEKTTISFMGWGTDSEIKTYQTLIDQFEGKYPDVEVEYIVVADNEFEIIETNMDEIEQEIVLSLAKRNSAFLEDDNA